MTSCSNEPSTIAEALRLGARDYLAIPFEKAALDEAMLRAKMGKPRVFLKHRLELPPVDPDDLKSVWAIVREGLRSIRRS